ncbi:hypothetical protein [Yinghuangia soli]|uniref:Uncharacterized protein n=1 Tax=Yinghuangia soli TaxID=2908204 RepID=A0AA41U1K6_9ACTN|nr:hypothetical protein [Yinghuangia soli]MCF2530878.1 hypothetical protein [Yinghuangia soli]
MGLFGKRKPAEDAVFPFLTKDEGVHLRYLVTAAFAAHGIAVTISGDQAVESGSRRRTLPNGNGNFMQFGLHNLAAKCAAARGVRMWSDVVAEHVDVMAALVAESGAGKRPVGLAEALATMYPKLTADALVLDTYGRPLAAGLRVQLARDTGTTVAGLDDAEVARLGPVEDLWRAAYANLRALPGGRHEAIVGENGGRYDLVADDSYFTASRLLLLDEAVAAVTGLLVIPENGVLVCVPNRRTLMFHRIRDASFVAAAADMVFAAARLHAGAQWPLTPDLLWWREGTVTALSSRVGDQVQVDWRGPIREVRARMAAGI